MAARDLESRIEDALASLVGVPVRVEALEPLGGGACQDNWKVVLRFDGGSLPGLRTFALRGDAPTSLPGSLSRRTEYAVLEAVQPTGAPVPELHWFVEDVTRPDAGAYFTEFVEGEAVGARVTRGGALASAREVLPEQLADALARIHQVTPETAPGVDLSGSAWGPGDDPADGALRFVTSMLDDLGEPRPAVEHVLRWLRENRPRTRELTLVHGDFRTGNLMVGPFGLQAVLDWEFAHWGDPLEDIGWLCVRDWRFGVHDLAVGGFCRRDRFYDAYTKASERALDPRDVHWWEVFGNVRWALGALHQGNRYSDARRDLELLAIPVRAVEMEYEALRLVEIGWDRLGSPIQLRPRQELPPGDDVTRLLEAIAHFLSRDIMPTLDDRSVAYRLRIASNLVRVVARDVASGGVVDLDELERLRAILGAPQVAVAGRAARRDGLLAMRRVLASWLREGSLTPGHVADIHRHLKQSLADRLAVTAPRFDLSRNIE